MRLGFILLAMIAGAFMPAQAGINARLKTYVGDPVWAAFISFAVGTVALFFYGVAFRIPWAGMGATLQAPLWTWSGGFMGAFFVASTILLAAKLGAASMTAWLVAAQLISSLLLDQFGIVGYVVRELSWQRVVGCALLVAGAVLMEKF